MSAPVYIGVDPAFRVGGFWAAIVDMTDKSVIFKGFANLLDWHDWLRSPDAPDNCFVCVENSNMQNSTFAYGMKGSSKVVAKISRDVGNNQAVSELAYISALRHYGDRAFQVSPKQKGKKWTPKQFGYIIAQDGVTIPKGDIGQDCRDAYQLACIARRMALVNGHFKK